MIPQGEKNMMNIRAEVTWKSGETDRHGELSDLPTFTANHIRKSILASETEGTVASEHTVYHWKRLPDNHLISVEQMMRYCARHDQAQGEYPESEWEGSSVFDSILSFLKEEGIIDEAEANLLEKKMRNNLDPYRRD